MISLSLIMTRLHLGTVKLLKYLAVLLAGLIVLLLIYIALPITYTLKVNDINDFYVGVNKPMIMLVLKLADSNDTVHLDIASNGGYAIEGFKLVNAIFAAKATVVTDVNLQAFSAGAIIAMAGDRLEVAPASVFLFHMPFYMNGDVKSVVTASDPMYTLNEQFMTNYVYKYFTPEEKALYQTGADVIISGVDMYKRVNKH